MNALRWRANVSTCDLSACICIATFARALAVSNCICKRSVFYKTPCQSCTLKRLRWQATSLNKPDMHPDSSVLLVRINSQGQMWVTIKQPSFRGKMCIFHFISFPFLLVLSSAFFFQRPTHNSERRASISHVSGSCCRSDVTIAFILLSALALLAPSHLHPSVLSLSFLFLFVTGGTWWMNKKKNRC